MPRSNRFAPTFEKSPTSIPSNSIWSQTFGSENLKQYLTVWIVTNPKATFESIYWTIIQMKSVVQFSTRWSAWIKILENSTDIDIHISYIHNFELFALEQFPTVFSVHFLLEKCILFMIRHSHREAFTYCISPSLSFILYFSKLYELQWWISVSFWYKIGQVISRKVVFLQVYSKYVTVSERFLVTKFFISLNNHIPEKRKGYLEHI